MDATRATGVRAGPARGGGVYFALFVNGGSDPAWSPAGEAIYYRDAVGALVRVATRMDGDQLVLSTPERITEIVPPSVGFLRNAYDFYPDGKSVVAFVDTRGRAPAIRIRTGW